MEVYENRLAETGRTLALFTVVLPAADPDPDGAKPPLFFLAGGPGDAATASAGGLGPYITPFLGARDLVFVDIRGTGRSAPLQCLPAGPADRLQPHMTYLLRLEDVRRCRDALSPDADLTQYTTSYAADDLDDVRAALGYPRMALFGGSYGTRLAQETVRRHPERIEFAVLLGVAPPSMTAPSGFARSQQDALDQLVELCANDAVCHGAYPQFAQQLAEVLARVGDEPARATVTHPAFDQPQDVTLAYGEFVMGLRFLAYRAPVLARFPQLIAAAHGGDYEPLLSLIALAYYDISVNFYKGLYFSMTCAEDLPFVDLEREIASSNGTVLGMYRMQQQLDICQVWPRGEADPHMREPLVSSVPVLLISGELDPVTPVANGDLVARTLSRSLHMVLAHRGHGALDEAAAACWLGAIGQLAEASSLDGVDIGCATELEPLPFAFEVPEDAAAAAASNASR